MFVFYLNYSSYTATWFPQQPGSSPQSHTDLLNRKGQSSAQEDGGLFRIIEKSKYSVLHIKLTLQPAIIITAAVSSRDCNRIELSPDEQSVKFQMG